MAAGLRYCDQALTVSPSYAVECCTDPEKGVELESLFTMAKCTGRASWRLTRQPRGILNGVKEGVSPSDKPLDLRFKPFRGPRESLFEELRHQDHDDLRRLQLRQLRPGQDRAQGGLPRTERPHWLHRPTDVCLGRGF